MATGTTGKFHVTPRGTIGRCTATVRACPYGEHFDTRDEAVKYLGKKFEEEFELLPQRLSTLPKEMKDKSRKISSRENTINYYRNVIKFIEDKHQRTEYAKRTQLAAALIDLIGTLEGPARSFKKPARNYERKQIEKYINQEMNNKRSYYQRLKWSKYQDIQSIDELNLNVRESHHYSEERKKRMEAIRKYLGSGNTVGILFVRESDDKRLSVPREEKKYDNHYLDIRDNGRVIVYGENGTKITSFILNESRAKLYFKMADLVPHKQFLNRVRLNKLASDLLGISHRDDEVENERKREEYRKQKKAYHNRRMRKIAEKRYNRKKAKIKKAKREEDLSKKFYDDLLRDPNSPSREDEAV